MTVTALGLLAWALSGFIGGACFWLLHHCFDYLFDVNRFILPEHWPTPYAIFTWLLCVIPGPFCLGLFVVVSAGLAFVEWTESLERQTRMFSKFGAWFTRPIISKWGRGPEGDKMTNPAALSALAKGDIDNFLVASTPGGIESQEKAGQALLVASSDMPKELRPDRASFERLGFVFGADVDELFVSAKLPPGWKRAATDHSMHSDIVDELGRKRVSVFYKAAFYDRRADAGLVPRFRIENLYPKHDGPIPHETMIPMVITDAGVEIHRLGESRYIGSYDEKERMEDVGRTWLDENRHGWRDIVTSWTI